MGWKSVAGKQLLLRPAVGGFVLSRPERGVMPTGLNRS